ncbi:MAG: PKD domain-containing protein [Candidatus Omnitrophica bacterium]|nr:PKD domain-containing protein [Candidatus Omnitrophota bacterium]
MSSGIVWLLVGLNLKAVAFGQQSGWLEGWTYRRSLKVIQEKDDFPVPPVAVLKFRAAAEDDGRDIRIVSPDGQEVSRWVVSVKSGNAYQVAFSPQAENYFLYYGNPSAKEPESPFQPQRGLILEVYPRAQGATDRWEQASQLVEKSRQIKLLARSFHNKIWDGSNPLGPEKDVLRVYTGYFYCRQPQTLLLATSSAGPSFITVDQQLIAAWPGWHRAVPFVRPEQSGAVELKPGLHQLKYYHFGQPGYEMAVAAIAEGQGKNFRVIPEKFFLPVSRVEVGPVEKREKPIAADFSWENTHYLYREQWELITYRFEDTSTYKTKIVSWEWDFGDGQRGQGETVYHTYLTSGFFTITLEVKDLTGKTDLVRMKVKVEPDAAKTSLPARPPEEYLQEFSSYDLSRFSVENLSRLAGILTSYEATASALKVYQEMLRRKLSQEQKHQTSLVAARLAWTRKEYETAENIYREMLKEQWQPAVALELANVLLLKKDLALAAEQYQKILSLSDKIPPSLRRKAEIGLADILREKGDFSVAKKEYERLTQTNLFDSKNGFHARNVLEALRNKDAGTALKRLQLWAEELPLVKFRGHWSVLFGRACLLKKDYENAWHELDLFIRSCQEKDNPYLVWALALAGESLEGLGQNSLAQEYYQRITKNYPTHPLAATASERLKSSQ